MRDAAGIVEVAADDRPGLGRWNDLRNAWDPVDAAPLDALVRPFDFPVMRALALDEEGQPAAAVRAWIGPGGDARMLVSHRPADWLSSFSRLHDHVVAWTRGHGGRRLRTHAYDHATVTIDAWLARRWNETGRRPVVGLDAAEVALPEDPAPTTLEFATLAEVPDRLRDVYELLLACWQQEPGTAGEDLPTFERWRRVHLVPASGDLLLLAVHQGQFVAVAELHRVHASVPVTAWHAYTGVHPAFRGRGIATRLKLRAIEGARLHGIQVLLAANDAENAAMRGINARLGYAPWFEYVQLELDLGVRTGASG